MKINHIFEAIARNVPIAERNDYYRVARAVLDVREALNMENCVACMHENRDFIADAIDDECENVHGILAAIFELPEVAEAIGRGSGAPIVVYRRHACPPSVACSTW